MALTPEEQQMLLSLQTKANQPAPMPDVSAEVQRQVKAALDLNAGFERAKADAPKAIATSELKLPDEIKFPKSLQQEVLAKFKELIVGALTEKQMGAFAKIFLHTVMSSGGVEKAIPQFLDAVAGFLQTEEGKEYIQLGADSFLGMIAKSSK